MAKVKDGVLNRLDNLCNEKGISLYELALYSGLPVATAYSLKRRTRTRISIQNIKILCDGLEISLGEFFSSPEFENLEPEIDIEDS